MCSKYTAPEVEEVTEADDATGVWGVSFCHSVQYDYGNAMIYGGKGVAMAGLLSLGLGLSRDCTMELYAFQSAHLSMYRRRWLHGL